MVPSRLLFREPERGVTLALREAPKSSFGGLDARLSTGVNLLGVGTPGLASLGVNGEDLLRVKAALRVGVKGLGDCLSVMTQEATVDMARDGQQA